VPTGWIWRPVQAGAWEVQVAWWAGDRHVSFVWPNFLKYQPPTAITKYWKGVTYRKIRLKNRTMATAPAGWLVARCSSYHNGQGASPVAFTEDRGMLLCMWSTTAVDRTRDHPTDNPRAGAIRARLRIPTGGAEMFVRIH
jgi:hypothetical protein